MGGPSHKPQGERGPLWEAQETSEDPGPNRKEVQVRGACPLKEPELQAGCETVTLGDGGIMVRSQLSVHLDPCIGHQGHGLESVLTSWSVPGWLMGLPNSSGC